MTTLLKFQEWYGCLFDADEKFFRKWYLAQLSRDIPDLEESGRKQEAENKIKKENSNGRGGNKNLSGNQGQD